MHSDDAQINADGNVGWLCSSTHTLTVSSSAPVDVVTLVCTCLHSPCLHSPSLALHSPCLHSPSLALPSRAVALCGCEAGFIAAYGQLSRGLVRSFVLFLLNVLRC